VITSEYCFSTSHLLLLARLIATSLTPGDLEEGEERSIVTEEGRRNPKVQQVISLLIDWINDSLAPQRIVVKDIVEDLYDGLVIQKLLEHYATIKVGGGERRRGERSVRVADGGARGEPERGRAAPEAARRAPVLSASAGAAQVAAGAALERRERAAQGPVRHPAAARRARRPLPRAAAPARPLPAAGPANNSLTTARSCRRLQTLVVQKRDGQLLTRYVNEDVTAAVQDDWGGVRGEKDAFDTLYDHAPEKASDVKHSLLTFANKHLARLNLEVGAAGFSARPVIAPSRDPSRSQASDVETSFQDGVFLVLLLGLLEGYFVPLHSLHLTPSSAEQRAHNVALAFELMLDAGLPRPRARPEDVVNGDLKSTSRVLYSLFTRLRSPSVLCRPHRAYPFAGSRTSEETSTTPHRLLASASVHPNKRLPWLALQHDRILSSVDDLALHIFVTFLTNCDYL